MNPDYNKNKFPVIEPQPWDQIFPPDTDPDAIDLISKLI
eukprot:CAMPEP_0176401680 /NCGR_PEP_ID=MMETSP0126-20121128/48635_1 /TAXON_ID=141414 ORGANISM="Strombidinopsis acuminatum, Strain SPMC142" /NCGR_SAMPLE_ID=MMETSP0126 /ASSEMBLY_ACC=CAM_ASM_000229 /LENGTH=38 /DNA_ID= /DNA_START= /DNA_END= /DNA_ORIENTATION=